MRKDSLPPDSYLNVPVKPHVGGAKTSAHWLVARKGTNTKRAEVFALPLTRTQTPSGQKSDETLLSKSPVAREWPVNKKAFSHYVLLGDEAPVPAIQTIGAVVSQGEIGVRFYSHARSGIA
jgi:hypothetical protein